jgi:hypothetical protein
MSKSILFPPRWGQLFWGNYLSGIILPAIAEHIGDVMDGRISIRLIGYGKAPESTLVSDSNLSNLLVDAIQEEKLYRIINKFVFF